MGAIIKQVRNLSILVGGSALLGCASIQTTDEYAISHGYQTTKIKGRDSFCRLEQREVLGEPRTDLPQRLLVRRCFKRAESMAMRYAGYPPEANFHTENTGLPSNPCRR